MLLFRSTNRMTDDQIKEEREKIIQQMNDGPAVIINCGLEFVGQVPGDSKNVEVKR